MAQQKAELEKMLRRGGTDPWAVEYNQELAGRDLSDPTETMKDKAEGYMHKSSVVPREGEFNEFLFNVGEAVAVDVKADTATLRAITTRDAFKTGDYVAIRK